MAYIPYAQRQKEDEKETRSGYRTVEQRKQAESVNLRDVTGVRSLISGATARMRYNEQNQPKQPEKPKIEFGIPQSKEPYTFPDGSMLITKTSTPVQTDYGTKDMLYDLFLSKNEVRPLFGREQDRAEVGGGLLTAGALSLGSRILEATPRIAATTVANYKALKDGVQGKKTTPVPIAFSPERLGLPAEDGNVIYDTGTRMTQEFGRRMADNPDKTKTNIALTVLNVPIMDTFDALGVGGITEVAARNVLKATKFDPVLNRSLQQLGLEGKDVSVEVVRDEFVSRAENLIKSGASEVELNQLGQATDVVMNRLFNEGIPQLNTFGRFMEDSSAFVLQDIRGGVRFGQPRFAPLGENVVPKTGEAQLPGYEFTPNPYPVGLSIQRVNRVGFGDDAGKGSDAVTTKIEQRLGDRKTVSRQFIEDLTNAPDLKQAEKALVRNTLQEFDGNKINVKDFVAAVGRGLVQLNRQSTSSGFQQYENVGLRPEERGEVENYDEVVYRSGIENSAGGVHFGSLPPGVRDDYFAHTRVEDLKGGETRRVIEIQSDLFQKGRLENEQPRDPRLTTPSYSEVLKVLDESDASSLRVISNKLSQSKKISDEEGDLYDELMKKGRQIIQADDIADYDSKIAGLNSLEDYRGTWWERIIREEVRRAADDGFKKIQFPTGETAMKIEGLSDDASWQVGTREATNEDLIIGEQITRNNTERWRITEVGENGNFKAVPKATYDQIMRDVRTLPGTQGKDISYAEAIEMLDDAGLRVDRAADESFNLSGSADTSNRIYRFYEKDVQRYLKNKYDGKRITDDNGVEWTEIDVPKDAAGKPVEAFSVAGIEQDEDGNIQIDPIKLGMGFFAGSLIRRGGKDVKKLLKEFDNAPSQVFHGTSNRAVAQIISEGFKAFDGVWGKGIYFGADSKAVKDLYVDKFKEDGVMLEVETFTENPLILDSKYNGLFETAKHDPALQKMIDEHVPGEDPIDLITYAKERGYDSIFAKDANELVVFDDSQITKITIDGEVVRDQAVDLYDDFAYSEAADIYNDMTQIIPVDKRLASAQEAVEEAAMRIELFREQLELNPAAELMRYKARSGEFKGGLPEVTGFNEAEIRGVKETGALEFARRGDDIVTELGFEDTEIARAAFDDFLAEKDRYKEMVRDFRGLKDELRSLKYEMKAEDDLVKSIQKEITERLNKKIYSRWQMKEKVAKATEKALERGQKKGEMAGRSAGYQEAKRQITARLRNSFGIQLDRVKRSAELDKLRTRIIERNRDEMRTQLTNYVKDNLPVNARGKFVTMIKNADTQKKLVKAYSRIDKAVQEIQKNTLVSDVKKKIKAFSDSPSIAVDYRQQIKALADEIDFKGRSKGTIQKLAKMRNFIDEQIKAGNDVTMPERIYKALEILQKRDVKQLSVADLQNLSDQIDILKQLGKTKQATRERLYDIEKKKLLDDLVSDTKKIEKHPLLTRRPGDPKLKISQRFRNVFPALLNAAQHVDLTIAPMDVFFDMLGGSKGSYTSAPSRIFKARTDANYSKYLQDKDELFNKVWDKADELGLDTPQFERIGIHAARVQKDGTEKLLNSGLTQAEIDKVVLSDSEMELYRFMRSELDAIRPQIEKVMREVYNRELGQVDNYFSFMTDFKSMTDTEVFQRVGGAELEEFGRARKNVEQGFTKERTGAGNQKIKIDAMEIFTKHMDNAAYLIHMGRDNKMLFEIANSPEFGEVAGDLGQRYTLEWLDLMARKGGKGADEQIAMLDALRRNVGAAYLGLKLSTVVIQPTALLDGASEIGTWAFRGARIVSTDRNVRKYIMEQFPEIRARVGDDAAFTDLGENETLNRIRDLGYWGIKKVDGWAASSTGWGAYLENLHKLGISVRIEKVGDDDVVAIFTKKGEDLTGDAASEAHRQSVAYAEKIVRNTQASSQFKDAPLAISRGSFSGNRSFDRAFFQFQTFVIRRWYRIRHDLYNGGIKQKNPRKIFNTFMYLSLAVLAEEGLRRAATELTDTITGNDSSQDPNRDGYTESVARSALSTVPFMSQGISMAVYDSDPVPALGAIRSLTTGGSQIATGASDETKIKGLIELSEGVAAMWGVPGAAQASQLAKDVVEQQSKGPLDDLEIDDLDLELDDIDLDIDLDLDVEI